MLSQGQTAPDFELKGDDGNQHRLSKHQGKAFVIVYFYPKDDTPGCTTEACDFRDNMQRFKNLSAVVYGISKDSIDSHEKFSVTHELNFTLLSDPDLHAHTDYGALADGKTIRSTFIVNKNGKIVKTWYKVSVKDHVNDIIQVLESLPA